MVSILENMTNNIEHIKLFENIFKRKEVIQRHLNAPLLNERLQNLEYWIENGAAKGTLRIIARYLLIIIDYLNLKHRRKFSISEIRKAGKKWARRSCNHLNTKDKISTSGEKCFICIATQWLNKLEWLQSPIKKTNPFDYYINSYIAYMRKDKGLSERTISNRLDFLNNFFIDLSPHF